MKPVPQPYIGPQKLKERIWYNGQITEEETTAEERGSCVGF